MTSNYTNFYKFLEMYSKTTDIIEYMILFNMSVMIDTPFGTTTLLPVKGKLVPKDIKFFDKFIMNSGVYSMFPSTDTYSIFYMLDWNKPNYVYAEIEGHRVYFKCNLKF